MKKELEAIELVEVDFSMIEDMEEIITPANQGSTGCCNETNNWFW